MSEINGNISAVEQITGNLYPKGEKGNGIDRIEKTNSVGLIDTYTIYFTDGNTTTFTITNGKNGIDGVNGTNGENGKSLQFNWNGTQLGIRTEGSTEYTYVDLKGNKGDKGDKGDPGEVTLEQLNNATKTTQTTDILEALTIENCAPVSAKLDIKSGKSEQATRSGKNVIIKLKTVANKQINYDVDKSKITNTMYLSLISSETLSSTNRIYLRNLSGNVIKNFGSISLTANTKGSKQLTLTDDEVTNFKNTDEDVYIQIYENNSELDYTSIDFREVMLSSNSDTTYEPYGVSPSPDYPSRIRNLGDNINLFDKDNANILNGYYIHATQKKLLADSNCKVLYIPCTNNETYSISKIKSERFIIGTTSNIPKDTNTTFTNVVQNNSATKLTIQAGANDKYLVVWYYNKSVDTTITEQEILDSIKIEKGSTPTPYTPYNCGSADFKVENKNFIDYNNRFIHSAITSQINNEELIITRKSSGASWIYFDVKGLKIGEYYTIKCNSRIIIYKDKIYGAAYSSSSNASNGHSFRAGQENYVIAIIIGSTDIPNIGDTLNCGKVQLEKGKVATDYIPHQEQIKSFPFTEGQVLHKGGYLASDGIHQKRYTYTITGQENGIYISNTLTNVIRWVIPTTAPTRKGNAQGICSHFSYEVDYNIDKEHIYIHTNSYIYLFIDKTKVSTLEELKTYLQEQYANGTPVTIEYELAEEIVIPYTTEQEEAYYELQHLLMYEGYTSIECIDEIKPDIQLTYWYNNELNKSYGERFDKVEDSINKLEKSDIYSTEEIVIGKWIDGKPLYRKVIVYTPTEIIGEKGKITDIYIPHGISNLKQLCRQECITSDGHILPDLNSSTGSNIDCSTSLTQIENIYNLCLRIINDTWGPRTWYISLEYTKTTD